MPTLATNIDGLALPNPFIIASGPPGTNLNVITKAFQEGWGAVIAKTVSLDAAKVINVTPRYAKLLSRHGEVIGWENIELISDRPLKVWEDEFKRCKDRFPRGVLLASVMEEYRRDAWIEIIQRCEAAGVDGFELNFSCPHGLTERNMGSAMGEDPGILETVCGWVKSATRKPFWAKMTPNITHIEEPSRGALRGGATGISAPCAPNRPSKVTAPPAAIRARPSAPSPSAWSWKSPPCCAGNFPTAPSPAWAALKPAATPRNSSCSAPTPCKSAPV
jgi:dihydropyrimidine dehydrogenase (NADP+)/dihydropyrimidine dehydrogenase (NAD+) subunit PreA